MTLSPWLPFPIASILISLSPGACAAPAFAQDSDLVDRVMTLIDRRLALMPEVAAYKYPRHQPVSDPVRERTVIEQSVAEARSLNLDADAARSFFAVQIEMAKAVEESSISPWQSGTMPPPQARDLVKEIRPELDAIGRELLPTVYLASPALTAMPQPALQARLSRLLHRGTTVAQQKDLAQALRSLRIVAPPTWAALMRIGTLRVGTTGDYPPYSDDQGGSLHGLDIDLTQSLAKAWGISVLYVRTSWPELMADLAAHRFDLAASGISITPERSRQAAFSRPYAFDGKLPIARRENAARFSSLQQIDQPGVRVIVNPGGTNERFARDHLHLATILVHADNRTIFEELVAGRADVMITDATEVRLQARRHPELAATMSSPLTRSSKAILMPAASDLLPKVDAWLKQTGDKVVRQQPAARPVQRLERESVLSSGG